MMYQSYGVHTPDTLPTSYSQDVFLEDFSTQRAVSQAARRSSRGSAGQQQRMVNAMRVLKPNSTNNSPRSSSMAARRRTMMGGEGFAPKRQQVSGLDYFSVPQSRNTRPLSWHPSSCLQIPQQQLHQQQQQQQPPQQMMQQQSGYSFPSQNLGSMDVHDFYAGQPQFSPLMTCYSNDTSPSSTFSPLPIFPGPEQAQFTPADGWDDPQKSVGYMYSNGEGMVMADSFPTLHSASEIKGTSPSSLDWNTFILQGFNSTTPPTPEAYAQSQQQLAVAESYVPLDEPEEEGEILVGMGLYDRPEKACEDPQLDNYRSTVSSLLGSPYRPQEPKGKGLKLEETWEPPQSEADDDEDAEDAEEEDAGDEEDEQ